MGTEPGRSVVSRPRQAQAQATVGAAPAEVVQVELNSVRIPYRVIMCDGVLLPGMTMPVLGPPPLDPHPNKAIQQMRDAWDMRIIAWEAVWPGGMRPRILMRRAGHQLRTREGPAT